MRRLPMLLLLPSLLAAAEWTGTWADQGLTIVLRGSADALAGELVVAGQRCAVQAAERGGTLQGTFTADGERYPFTGALRDGVLVLTSDGSTYELVRARANPLARPAAPSPGSPVPAPLPADPLVGTWRGSEDTAELAADGTLRIGGMTGRWRAGGGILTLELGGAVVPMAYRIQGDRLTVTGADGQEVYQRVAAPAAPAPAAGGGVPAVADGPLTAAALVGVWLAPTGASVLSADGSGRTGRDAYRWSVDGGMLVLMQDGRSVKVPARLDGGRLILGSGPSVTLDRAEGAAGCWVGTDGHVDPSMAMVITHRIALRPDGSVGYAKGELDAGRRDGWFTMRREDGAAAPSAGRWHQDAGQVAFSLGSGRYTARFDPARQRLVVAGMGQVNEGADLEFERE